MHTFVEKQKSRFFGEVRLISAVVFVAGLAVALAGSVSAQKIVLDPTAIDFGKVLIGESAQRTLTISNEGTEDLIVSSVSVSSRAFAVDPTSLTVPADSSSSVLVTFTPGGEGLLSATLTVASNDPDEPTVEIPLSGTGAYLEATLSVADGYGDPGTSGNKVSIVMDNTLGVAGLNFVLNFDPDVLEPTEVVATARTAEMSIFNENLQYGPGQAILVIADLEGDTIPPGSGPIATFYFDVAPGALLGEYPLSLTDVVLADVEGQAIYTDVVNGTFVVTGPSGEAWAVSLTATSSDPEEPSVDLIFGVDPEGTDEFDPDLDDLAAPPPPGREFTAYFSIGGLFDKLTKDIRSSTVLTVAWTLVTEGRGGTLTWDPESLPHDAQLVIDGSDMSVTGSMEFAEDDTLTITYTYQDQTPPADVTDLLGLAGDRKAILTWTASVSGDVRGYKVYVDSAGVRVDEIDVGDVTYFEVGGLANLVTYTFTVTAYDEVGNESFGVSVDVVPNPGYYGAVMLTLGSSAHEDTARVFFGLDPEASDGLDAGLDIPCPPDPPLPPELKAYFPLDHPDFPKLCTDIRNSLVEAITWILVTEGTGGEICWDPDDLPESGQFILNDEINMRDESCAQFAANDTLTIFYSVWVSVEPYRETPIPEEYVLVQNYPNPFNPETTIEYRLPESGEVRLEVFNLLGQHIRTLVDGRQEVGYYAVTWDGIGDDGAPVASGVYFYRLQAGEFTATRSMLLLK